MSLFIEIEGAQDPDAFESKRAKHPDSLGEKGDWCKMSAEGQARSRDKSAFKDKLVWHCKKMLEGGRERRAVEDYYRYYLRHFDYYLDVIEWYPELRSQEGKDLIHEYCRQQQTEKALVFKHFIDDAYQRKFGRPGIAKAGRLDDAIGFLSGALPAIPGLG